MNVINLDDERPHKVTEVICLNCGKKFVSVSPENTTLEQLECPQCHKQGYVTIDNIKILKEE